jgi:glycosyltransferase involved in cell wall biosynthesis
MGTPAPAQEPAVSVIIPARNEEANLRPCLESLVSQEGIAFETIVVDDGSTDATRAIAQAFPSVRVIESGPLPPGWTGKNNAVTAGARQARGKWLLFTDADTVHKPGSLAAAVKEAEEYDVDLLSYSPEQEVHGFWERAVMPVIFADLAREYPPSAISENSSKVAAANGQYLLISRAAYDKIGGHAAVAQSLLEDVALARAVRRASLRIRFRYAPEAVRTRMYRSFEQLREGWTKNLSLLFPATVPLAVIRAVEFLITMACLTIGLASSAHGVSVYTILYLFVPYMTYRRIATAHFSWSSTLLGILGLPVFSYLLVRSKLHHASGDVSWKGRIYPGKPGVTPIS